jgi:hypothetical protein
MARHAIGHSTNLYATGGLTPTFVSLIDFANHWYDAFGVRLSVLKST